MTCQRPLRIVFNEVLQIQNITIIFGARTIDEQLEMIRRGTTRLRSPYRSRHVVAPDIRHKSAAIDVAPWWPDKPHVHWDDHGAFSVLAGVAKAVASRHGVGIRWGGDWDRDGRTVDNRFNDLGHFELIEEVDDGDNE
jgi:peptidoglycan L-alanyl-D-glutamate endopeptidase CwlK